MVTDPRPIPTKKSDCPHFYPCGIMTLCYLTSTTCKATREMDKCNMKLIPEKDCPPKCPGLEPLCEKVSGCQYRTEWLEKSVKKNVSGKTITKSTLDDIFEMK